MTSITRESLYKAIDELPDESLGELHVLVTYLQHKQTHPGSAWLRAAYDAFAPVREAIAETGMTEEEINAILHEELEAVRQEHYLKQIAEEKLIGNTEKE